MENRVRGQRPVSPLSLMARPWIIVISVRIVCQGRFVLQNGHWTFAISGCCCCCLLICLSVIIKGVERTRTDASTRVRSGRFDKKRQHQLKGTNGVVFLMSTRRRIVGGGVWWPTGLARCTCNAKWPGRVWHQRRPLTAFGQCKQIVYASDALRKTHIHTPTTWHIAYVITYMYVCVLWIHHISIADASICIF